MSFHLFIPQEHFDLMDQTSQQNYLKIQGLDQMTTPQGVIRGIDFVLNNEQHVAHNNGNVIDLLRDAKSAIAGLLKSENYWLERCAVLESNTKPARPKEVGVPLFILCPHCATQLAGSWPMLGSKCTCPKPE